MDKAAILSEIFRRNALRQAHGLPLLDVPNEYAHQLSVARQREYHAVCDEHVNEREAIRHQVLAEYRAKCGPDYGASMGGQWAIGHQTRVRFTAYMAARYGIHPPGRSG